MLPFLRWAGGKRKLARLISDAIPQDFINSDRRFYEPFVGGGAVMLHLGEIHSLQFVPGTRLAINDLNPDLVITYRVIQKKVRELITELRLIETDVSKEAYLRIRAEVPSDDLKRAARFIYLNKTSFNGLWRVNTNGQFNVPWGQLKNPTIFDEQNLLSISKRLKGSTITHSDYQAALASAGSGDLVYLDPPYIPLSASASFSKYAKEDFNLGDQEKLAEYIENLSDKGVKVILSNSDTPLSRQIFGQVLQLRQISVARLIAAKSTSRGNVMEILGVNFNLDEDSSIRTLALIN